MKITIKKSDIINELVSYSARFGSGDWAIYTDKTGLVNCRHFCESMVGWVMIVSLQYYDHVLFCETGESNETYFSRTLNIGEIENSLAGAFHADVKIV